MKAVDFYPRTTVIARSPVPAVLRRQLSTARRLMVIRPEDVEWMLGALRGRGWRTATDLGARSGGQKRRLKAIVEVAAGEILHFRGSPGFCLTGEATRGQIVRGIATLRIDARTPLRRARHYLRHLKGRQRAVTGELFPKK